MSQIPLIVIVLGMVGGMCWIPALHASFLDHSDVARDFFYAGILITVLSVMLGIATRNPKVGFKENTQLGALAAAYLILPFAMALPMVMTLPNARFLDVWFEMLASFTTTGASVFEPRALAPSLHLWRALMGWFGGFCILVSATAILAPLNLGGHEVISGRVPGHVGGQAGRQYSWGDRLYHACVVFFPIYTGLTLILWAVLAAGGEDGFIALGYAMGVMSTSGISTSPYAIGTGIGTGSEIWMFCFMLFALSRRSLPIRHRMLGQNPWYQDVELRLGLIIIAVVVVVLLLRHGWFSDGDGLSQVLGAFWGTAFIAASFLTTTGYESEWWQTAREWSAIGSPGLILLGLAMVGGGVATTAGGVTLLRLSALLIQARHELERVVHPHIILAAGPGGRRLGREGAYMAWVFFMLFAIVLAVVMVVLAASGLEFTESLILSIAAFSTTGPLATVAGPEPISWAKQSDFVKIILAITMVLGRIETLAIIALLSPRRWGNGWLR